MPTIWSKITGVVASSPSFIPLLCVGWAGTEKSWLAQNTQDPSLTHLGSSSPRGRKASVP